MSHQGLDFHTRSPFKSDVGPDQGKGNFTRSPSNLLVRFEGWREANLVSLK